VVSGTTTYVVELKLYEYTAKAGPTTYIECAVVGPPSGINAVVLELEPE
jgi:hypothetical protein